MSGLRKHFTMGLVLLMCTLTSHCGCAPSAAPVASGRDAQDYRRMIEVVKHVEESRSRNSAKTESPLTSRARTSAVEPRDLRSVKTERGDQGNVFPKNLKKKGKFLQHIAGPLYFSHKCRKHAYRLYHHTRDCTIPAYFKRCARLLTRLAGSPQCTEG